MYSSRTTHTIKRTQRGAAFIVMLVILIMGAAAFLVSSLNSSALQIARDQVTADALAKAKDALIGYAASTKLDGTCISPTNCARPGELPCPDTSNSGSAAPTCSGNALGRLPWKTLGLPDLRDSSGERLWYAVSSNFKKSPRTVCDVIANTGCLNSDTPGSISVFGSNGILLNDGGAAATGVVAVIIAPGEILHRQDGVQQDRSIGGINTANNYLDIATVGGNTEDNANFVDGSSNKGFIQGRIKDSNGNVIVNDQVLSITQDNIMSAIQKRVIGEVKQCLIEYAFNNNGRYPWAVPLNDLTNYQDSSDQLFGRIPDDLDNTQSDSSNTMSNKWGINCNTDNLNTPSTWWINWREMIFYGLANKYTPNNTSGPSFPSTCATMGNCLNINTPSTPSRFVVIAAGKMLSTQLNRNANKTLTIYYLEGGNQNADQSGGYTFTQSSPSLIFNDTVAFQ